MAGRWGGGGLPGSVSPATTEVARGGLVADSTERTDLGARESAATSHSVDYMHTKPPKHTREHDRDRVVGQRTEG